MTFLVLISTLSGMSHSLFFSSFVIGGPSHLSALLVGLAVLIVAIFVLRRNAESTFAKAFLGLLILGNATAVFHTSGSHFLSGQTSDLTTLLPLHLCDLTSLFAAAALLTRRPLLCELTYYLGLGGTLQGLITPNLHQEFPHPVYFSFFQTHLFVVLAALLLPLGLGWRPRRPLWQTTSRVFAIICGYLILIALVNLALGTNYAFVMRKPENPSLYDHLGPHPWYLLSVLALVLAMLAILSLPFLHAKKDDLAPK